MTRVDVSAAKQDVLSQQELERRPRVLVSAGQHLFLAGFEDIILQKLD